LIQITKWTLDQPVIHKFRGTGLLIP
jgi:hypothetical protein